ncbi:Vacuolar membrane amino acid uptake transporter fnx2 [Hypsizygus marmoreus]|uniref:Vacuolar membrane amino acid uptake transporter fnx2 n=1 Tax=Hypsizygus marmoreus TaxID=39966 RepID=A0A369JEZ4_HYPMA|nr:Vacuolar membrane amino acid uptake transporter fnx2 [Hypsizygus marmoreus]
MADETSPLLGPDSTRNEPTYIGNGGNQNVDEISRIEASHPEVSGKSHLTFVIPMAIGIFLAAMDGTIVVSSYAAIGSELNQLQNTSWIATAYMLTMTSFQPLYGKLSDIFGRKACLLFAYTTFAIGCLLCGLSRDMTELIAARAFAGIGGGGMTTIVSIILSDVVPLRSRGTWQGILNIIFATGSAAGAPLGGFLSDSIGWRWAFLIQVPIALFAIVSVSLALRLPKQVSSDFSEKLKRVDFAGAIVLILTVFSLLFGLDHGGNVSWSDSLTLLSLGASFVFFILFGLIEAELASEPFAPKRIIFNRSLIASYLVNFFGMAAGMSMLFHVSLYLQAVQGRSASSAGLWLVLSVVGALLGSLGGGLTIQATGKFYLITVAAYGAQFVGAGVVLAMTGVVLHSALGVGIGLVVSSIGNGGGITTSLIALIANAGQADQAIATAVSYLFRSLGAVVGVSVGSTLVQETLRTYLRRNLSGEDVEEIIQHVRASLSYVDQLDAPTKEIVKNGYGQAVHVTLSFTLAMAACAFVSSIFIKEKAISERIPTDQNRRNMLRFSNISSRSHLVLATMLHFDLLLTLPAESDYFLSEEVLLD